VLAASATVADCLDMTRLLPRVVPVAFAMLSACRDAKSAVFPDTPLGQTGRNWLAAHNRAEGHAAVHFAMVNRGDAPANGAQIDSMISSSVRFAERVGPLTPIKLSYATDTAMAVLLRAKDGGLWTARFTPAVQPALVKVAVEVTRGGEPGLARRTR
jgi:hypothetical protein